MSRSKNTQPAYPHEHGHERHRRLHQLPAHAGRLFRRYFHKAERHRVHQELHEGHEPVAHREPKVWR